MSKTLDEQIEFNRQRTPESQKRLEEYFDKAEVLRDDDYPEGVSPENKAEFIKNAAGWSRELAGGQTDEEYQAEIKEAVVMGDGDNELEVLMCWMFG